MYLPCWVIFTQGLVVYRNTILYASILVGLCLFLLQKCRLLLHYRHLCGKFFYTIRVKSINFLQEYHPYGAAVARGFGRGRSPHFDDSEKSAPAHINQGLRSFWNYHQIKAPHLNKDSKKAVCLYHIKAHSFFWVIKWAYISYTWRNYLRTYPK